MEYMNYLAILKKLNQWQNVKKLKSFYGFRSLCIAVAVWREVISILRS
jgi:hypothetical protein